MPGTVLSALHVTALSLQMAETKLHLVQAGQGHQFLEPAAGGVGLPGLLPAAPPCLCPSQLFPCWPTSPATASSYPHTLQLGQSDPPFLGSDMTTLGAGLGDTEVSNHSF